MPIIWLPQVPGPAVRAFRRSTQFVLRLACHDAIEKRVSIKAQSPRDHVHVSARMAVYTYNRFRFRNGQRMLNPLSVYKLSAVRLFLATLLIPCQGLQRAAASS